MTDTSTTTASQSKYCEPTSNIISVYQLLQDKTLTIPQYQRPYKWTSKNINQLFADINVHKDKTAYRLGTIVFHQDKDSEQKNIVDGQQRTISLLLAARALIQRYQEKKFDRKYLNDQISELQSTMGIAMKTHSFDSITSQTNIYNNYREINRIVSRAEFTEEHIDFFLHKCQIVTITLNDVSEAFQFFDSQNARGRDLDPHDLLKAYHLREFSPHDEELKVATVARWENSDTKALATLFSQYLYRIRNWSKKSSARYFSKEDTDLFKGVNIDTVDNYPYVEQLRIVHHFVDNYNGQYERKIDDRSVSFPFHLDQTIINGRRFFEMTAHYQEKIAQINQKSGGKQNLKNTKGFDGFASKILDTINNYPARTRTGDVYVRSMFDCLLIYYIDKFGYAEIFRAIEKIFIWAYSLRLKMQIVQLASMDNYVLDNNLFSLIKDATRPADFINFTLPPVIEKKSTKTEKIEMLFKAMKYYE